MEEVVGSAAWSRVRVHLRASPRSSLGTALPAGVETVDVLVPASASVRELRNAVAEKLQAALLQNAAQEEQESAAMDLAAIVRNQQTKVVFGGQMLSETDTLALDEAGVRDGASLNIVLPARPHLIMPPVASRPPLPTTLTDGRSARACYEASLPHVDDLQPSVGLTTGGQRVLIVGSNFMPNCRCRFGPTLSLPLIYHSAELVEVVSPPHPAGIVSVQIMNPMPQARAVSSAQGIAHEREEEHTTESSQQGRAEGSWSNSDVLFHYISREQLEREVLVPAAADTCREKIAEALYGMGASSINYRRDDEDGFMG